MTASDSISVIQLTDLHLLSDQDADFKGQYPWHNLQRIMQQIIRQGLPDLFLLTGDLSQDESDASYRMLFDLMQSTGVPWHWMPGNHDNLSLMETLHPVSSSVVIGQWQWLLLNSQSGEPHGALSQQQKVQLQNQLEQPETQWQAVALHHQPLMTGPGRKGLYHHEPMDNSQLLKFPDTPPDHAIAGEKSAIADEESAIADGTNAIADGTNAIADGTNAIAGIDSIPLRDQGWLWETLSQYPQVKGVICGHVHQAHEITVKGLTLYTSPATSVQFAAEVNEFQLDTGLLPGYRKLIMTADGKIDTQVFRA